MADSRDDGRDADLIADLASERNDRDLWQSNGAGSTRRARTAKSRRWRAWPSRRSSTTHLHGQLNVLPLASVPAAGGAPSSNCSTTTATCARRSKS